jgi:hypothetical protein
MMANGLRWMQVGMVLATAVACAQTRRGPEPVADHDVTRAVAVYEWTGEMAKPTAARVVPVSLYINKGYEDAGLYLSRPVPLALETGNLYRVEKAGVYSGTVELTTAMHLHVPENAVVKYDDGWFAYGSYKPEVKAVSASQSVILSDDRPHFAKHGAASTVGTDVPAADADRPKLRKAKQDKQNKEVDGASVSEAGGLLNDDPNRPRLHRGGGEQVHTAELKGVPVEMHQAVLVNDAVEGPEHNFAYVFATEEDRASAENAVREMARALLRPVDKRGRYAPIALMEEDFRAFETSYGGAVVYAYSAKSMAETPRTVTLLVEPDIYGHLVVLIQQVMDADAGMRLVDAVDAAGDNRAELLYEVRTDNSRIFKLLRVMPGRVEEVFSTGRSAL